VEGFRIGVAGVEGDFSFEVLDVIHISDWYSFTLRMREGGCQGQWGKG
jgi:hypothetical protein